MSEDFSALHKLYRAELLERTIPFWLKYGLDWAYGGICTCVSDEGEVLSGDKYVWSQLRAIWTFSALYNKIERKPEYLEAATHIFNFIQDCGRNDRGEWYFCLNENGQPLFDGATSIYCDGFAIYGFTEFARATGNQGAINLALQTYNNVQPRLARPGSYQTHPLPIPAGTKAHGISMIFASAFGELGEYLNDRAITDAALDHARQVMDVFRRPADRRLYEFVSLDDSPVTSPPGRVVNPGHAIESMWFMLHLFQRENDQARIQQAIDTIRWHLQLGWDDDYGGLLLARDAEGSFWEKKWDMKIWWPHTEALYALLLAYSISKEAWCLDWFKRMHDYTFSHFPVPEYGEWTQNLDRQGRRIKELVALPVKDPFHLARALIYSVGVLEQLAKSEA
ncbi:MAG: AGE family epimerase/isomerase [Thermoflexales bacterium]|nr:AGE family epimerase/isomerase [Thermoflexales bacterium]